MLASSDKSSSLTELSSGVPSSMEGNPKEEEEADRNSTNDDKNSEGSDAEDSESNYDDEEYDDFESENEMDEFSASYNDSVSYFSSANSVESDGQTFDSFASRDAASVADTEADGEVTKVAERESVAVKWSRIAAFVFILVIATMLPFALHSIGSNYEDELFETDFDDFADELGNAWQENLEHIFVTLDAFAVDLTLAVSPSTWPLVTVPAFPVWGTNSRYLAPAIQSISLAPTVTSNERLAFEAFTQENTEWLDEALQWQFDSEFGESNRRNLQALDTSMASLAKKIYEIDGENVAAKEPGPFSPVRHVDPISPRAVNYDLRSNAYMLASINDTTGNNEASLGPLLLNDADSKILTELFAVDADDVLLGTIIYPVHSAMRGDGDNKGVLASIISWNILFEDVLPQHAKGVVCVIKNSCSQTVSLEINGSEVGFLGYKDLHDESFSRMGQSYELDFNLKRTTASQVAFAQEGPCKYTLTVYPSTDTKGVYESNNPTIFAAAAAGAFLLALVVFVMYDCIQERRNQLVLKAATEARAIVSSLFPAVVRDRLFETNREKEKQKKTRREKRRLKKKKKKRKTKEKGNDAPDEILAADSNITESPVSDDREKAPSPLPPMTVQQIMENVHPSLSEQDLLSNRKGAVSHPKHRLKSFLAHSPSLGLDEKSDDFGLNKPIADLFPHCTVLFADIVGFTAWSSEREPEQVFTLLQTVYHAFDKIAKRRGVFKVETIGDCYVAVTGLPDPQPDHAMRMTKFARECTSIMTEVTKKLEVSLGPDTGDLCMRLGLNSGQVTAGVLQGEKSRFQLFGDTVNTASRMESTGERNRIHVSKSTADLLIDAGKSYWVKPREDLVHAKGKGRIQTYWLVSRTGGEHSGLKANKSSDGSALLGRKRMAPNRTRSALMGGDPVRSLKRTTSESVAKVANAPAQNINDKREERLIQWQVELFVRHLKKIVAAREETMDQQDEKDDDTDDDTETNVPDPLDQIDRFSQRISNDNELAKIDRQPSFRMPTRQVSVRSLGLSEASLGASAIDMDHIVVDEVAEIISLPQFNPKSIKALEDYEAVELNEVVVSQLKDYITTIAQMYRQNPFHNFEHASHVTMSANKLLNRIVIPENVDYERETNAIASDLHDYTYGITSDPLTQFAVVFSALIHDADHCGVPNGQLAKENPEMATLYRNQSVAEQNSVDLAWDLFMDPRYQDLQNCIAATGGERKRFRQLVVNSVLATDIFDKTMKDLRNKRWDKAFHREQGDDLRLINDVSIEDDRNMKATIVIEHIIQASDVAHTMQHWHIYQKWNERLFDEMYSAFECGRSDKNPADGWYKGEMWFFDNYVIPLAKKLEECNVFGVASDEYLSYAIGNRNEWSIKGEEVVQQMVDRYQKRKFFVAGIAKKRAPTSRKSRVPRRSSNT